MFDLERFVEDCREAQENGKGGQGAVQDLLTRALEQPNAVIQAIGEPQRAGAHKIYHSDRLTILNLVWGPHMTLMPHNHQMWAVIGLYTGREDNIFWRRVGEGGEARVEAAGAKALGVKDCAPLGKDIIHSVTNPVPRLTGALHIYGGDFFNEPRSEWDPEMLTERPFNMEVNMALFEKSNRLLEQG